jgi:hypothetical protein
MHMLAALDLTTGKMIYGSKIVSPVGPASFGAER